jgi:triacylglycerol lipase
MNLPKPGFFDIENARQLVLLAQEAYNVLPTDPRVAYDPGTDTLCLIIETSDDLVYSFCGTKSRKNVLTDVNAKKIEIAPGIKMHKGFKIALDSVYAKLASLCQPGCKKRIWLIGHSLGGALAVSAAFQAARSGIPIAGVYTFGQPRVFNPAGATAYDVLLRDITFRVVDREDIVPRVPWLLGNYKHCGHEVFSDWTGEIFMDPPIYLKGISDIFGTWQEYTAAGRDKLLDGIAQIQDHQCVRYVSLLH